VTATAPGMSTAQTDVTLGEGQTHGVNLKLDAVGASPAAAAVPPPPSPAAPPPLPATAASAPVEPAPAAAAPPAPAASSSPNRTPAYVVLGIGAAGLVVGTIFGVVALGNKSSLDSDCPAGKNACPSTKGADVSSLNSSLNTNAGLSSVGFGVGIVGAVVGGILFLLASSDAPKTGALEVKPWLGLGSGGLNGTF
jgi:hypothetical protein